MVAFVRPKILKNSNLVVVLQLICKELNSKTLSASALEFSCVVFHEGLKIPVGNNCFLTKQYTEKNNSGLVFDSLRKQTTFCDATNGFPVK